MKKHFLILAISLLGFSTAFADYGDMEKCNAIEQVPNVLTQGTISRVVVMSSEATWDLVLLMKIRESGEIKSLPMGYVENPENKMIWQNGPLSMTANMSTGHYYIFKGSQKVLTLACGE